MEKIILDNSSEIQHLSAISIRFVILVLFLIIALIENFFLLLLTIGPMSKWFRHRYELKFLLATTSSLGRRQSEVGSLNQRKNYSCESLRRYRHCEECQARLKKDFSSLEDNDHELSCTARFARYYFGNLCLANFLLALVAIPGTLLACLGINQSNSIESLTEALNTTTSKPNNAIAPHTFLKGQKMNSVFCTLMEASVASLAFAIIFCLVQLTADRLLAVTRPFQYPTIMTQNRAFINIVIGWCIAILLGIMPHATEFIWRSETCQENDVNMEDVFKCFIFGQHSFNGHKYFVLVYFSLAYLVPVLFMIIAYIKMYCKAKELNRRSVKCETYSLHNELTNPRVSVAETNFIGENKAAFRAFWLVITFLSLTLPYFVLMFLSGITNFSYQEKEKQDHKIKDLNEVIRSICVWLLYVNAILTPGFYAYTDRVLRSRFIFIFSSSFANYPKDRRNSQRSCKSCKSINTQETKDYISVM